MHSREQYVEGMRQGLRGLLRLLVRYAESILTISGDLSR